MYFGIDFGTTNSACIGIQEGRRSGVKYTDGYANPFPSLVIIDKTTGKVYCGRDAWKNREKLSESCEVIPSIKTHLGTDKTWLVNGRNWTAEMVAAEVFLGLKQRVEQKDATNNLTSAVVATPVGFSAKKRKSLRKAAKIANVNIKNFISEPTAALFKHYDDIGFHSKIGVFDWGGGTLDVAIIENRKGKIKELATASLYLGGDNIDRDLAEWVHSQVAVKKAEKTPFDRMSAGARDKLIANCEQAKKDLTYDEQTEIRIWNYGNLGEVNTVLDIDKFRALVSSKVKGVVEFFQQTVEQAGLNFEELGCILMVGGSVNLRPFAEKIDELWGDKAYYPQDSAWSVAQGAASLSISPGKYVLAQSIVVVMSDGSFYPLINEGDSFHKEQTYTHDFSLVEDSPTANFIFSDEKKNTLGHLHVPAFGFFKEKIVLKTSMTEDLTVRVVAKSNNRDEITKRQWTYTNVRMNYQLPVTKIEVAEDE